MRSRFTFAVHCSVSHVLVMVVALPLFLSGCLGSGPKHAPVTPPNQKTCEPTSHTYEPIAIKGHKHVYFDSSLLSLLDDPTFVIDSAVLTVNGTAKVRVPSSSAIEEKSKKKKKKKKKGNGSGIGSGSGNGNSGDEWEDCDDDDTSSECVEVGEPDPTPTPAPTATPVTTATPAPTATPSPTATPAPTATPGEVVDATPSSPSTVPETQKGHSGKYQVIETDFDLSLNGLQLTQALGSLIVDENGNPIYHMHKMRVNGSDSVLWMMAKIRRNKGDIKLSFHGRKLNVEAVTLTITGHNEGTCGEPEPTPTPIPPSVSISGTTPSVSPTSSTTLEVAFTSDQASVNYACSLDGAAFATCLSPVIYASLSNGSHTFQVKSTNSYGLSSPIAQYQWMVDTLAPSVTIEPVQSPTNHTSFFIPFTSNDANATYDCKLDSGDPYPCSSPVELLGLPGGDHSLEIAATDALGNHGLPAHVEWQIDLTPPTTTITETIPSANPSSATSREIVFVASESSSFECSLDGAVFSTCASPMTLAALTEGWHRFEIRAIDATGNVGPAAAATWANDFTAPTVTFGSTIPAAGNTNATNFQVEFSGSESGSFYCSLDGATEQACTSPFSGPFAIDGQHTVSVALVDEAGLRSAPLSVNWNVDSSAPEISFSSILPSASARLNTTSMEFVIQSSEPVSLMGSFDGGAAQAIASDVLYDNLSEGAHTFSVTGTDQFGNALNTITHSFFVDRTAPSLSFAAEITGATTRTVNSFTFTADEEATFECELDGAGFSACSSVTMISGVAEGAHTYGVRATDSAGNVSATAQAQWSVDYTAPSTSVSSTQLAPADFRFDFTSSESNSTFVCSFDGSVEASCTSPITKTGLAAGSHSLIVHAIDALGNRDLAGAQIAVQVEEDVQTFLANPGVILTNQKSLTFNFSSNVSGATFLCSLDNGAEVACSSPRTYTNLADGSHTFKVRAKSPSGTTDPVGQSHSWTVDSASPVILSASTTSTTTTISVVWTTNEMATAQLRWGLGFTLTNTTAETGYATSHSIVINGLNPNTVYSIQMTGKDLAGNVYQSSQQSIRTRF